MLIGFRLKKIVQILELKQKIGLILGLRKKLVEFCVLLDCQFLS